MKIKNKRITRLRVAKFCHKRPKEISLFIDWPWHGKLNYQNV